MGMHDSGQNVSRAMWLGNDCFETLSLFEHKQLNVFATMTGEALAAIMVVTVENDLVYD
jgi:hypothetical protein